MAAMAANVGAFFSTEVKSLQSRPEESFSIPQPVVLGPPIVTPSAGENHVDGSLFVGKPDFGKDCSQSFVGSTRPLPTGNTVTHQEPVMGDAWPQCTFSFGAARVSPPSGHRKVNPATVRSATKCHGGFDAVKEQVQMARPVQGGSLPCLPRHAEDAQFDMCRPVVMGGPVGPTTSLQVNGGCQVNGSFRMGSLPNQHLEPDLTTVGKDEFLGSTLPSVHIADWPTRTQNSPYPSALHSATPVLSALSNKSLSAVVPLGYIGPPLLSSALPSRAPSGKPPQHFQPQPTATIQPWCWQQPQVAQTVPNSRAPMYATQMPPTSTATPAVQLSPLSRLARICPRSGTPAFAEASSLQQLRKASSLQVPPVTPMVTPPFPRQNLGRSASAVDRMNAVANGAGMDVLNSPSCSTVVNIFGFPTGPSRHSDSASNPSRHSDSTSNPGVRKIPTPSRHGDSTSNPGVRKIPTPSRHSDSSSNPGVRKIPTPAPHRNLHSTLSASLPSFSPNRAGRPTPGALERRIQDKTAINELISMTKAPSCLCKDIFSVETLTSAADSQDLLGLETPTSVDTQGRQTFPLSLAEWPALKKSQISQRRRRPNPPAKPSNTNLYLFNFIDADGDGMITPLELRKVCINYPEIATLFGVDRDHTISQVMNDIVTKSKEGINYDDFLALLGQNPGECEVPSLTRQRMVYDVISHTAKAVTLLTIAETCVKQPGITKFLAPYSNVPGFDGASKLQEYLLRIHGSDRQDFDTKSCSFDDFCNFTNNVCKVISTKTAARVPLCDEFVAFVSGGFKKEPLQALAEEGYHLDTVRGYDHKVIMSRKGSPILHSQLYFGPDGTLFGPDGQITSQDGQPFHMKDMLVGQDMKPLLGQDGILIKHADVVLATDGVLLGLEGKCVLGADGEYIRSENVYAAKSLMVPETDFASVEETSLEEAKLALKGYEIGTKVKFWEQIEDEDDEPGGDESVLYHKFVEDGRTPGSGNNLLPGEENVMSATPDINERTMACGPDDGPIFGEDDVIMGDNEQVIPRSDVNISEDDIPCVPDNNLCLGEDGLLLARGDTLTGNDEKRELACDSKPIMETDLTFSQQGLLVGPDGTAVPSGSCTPVMRGEAFLGINGGPKLNRQGKVILNKDVLRSHETGEPLVTGIPSAPITRVDLEFDDNGILMGCNQLITGKDGLALTAGEVLIGYDGKPLLCPKGFPITEDELAFSPLGVLFGPEGVPILGPNQEPLQRRQLVVADGRPMLTEAGLPLCK